MEYVMFFYNFFLAALFVLAPFIFFSLLFITAPYGRYSQKNWGPTVSTRMGWILMEFPAVLTMLVLFTLYAKTAVIYVFLIIWEMHYISRTFIYPLRLKNANKPMPILIVISGAFFNSINGFTNGISLTLINQYEISWLYDPRFIIGIFVFMLGFIINQHSDRILLKLRTIKSAEYQIPQGGLFRWISCPNYLGEIMEWTGWAIATWSLAGLAFALWTIANLLPRALAHHAWYQRTFAEYPKSRRALI